MNNIIEYDFSTESVLSIPDENKLYWHDRRFQVSGITLLMKWILSCKEYPELENNIEHYLEENPNEINKKNSIGWTPLMLASKYANSKSTQNTLKILLKYVTDINYVASFPYNGIIINENALKVSCEYSNTTSSLNTVQILIEAGADINWLIDGEPLWINIFLFYNFHHLSFELIKLLSNYIDDLNIISSQGESILMNVISFYDFYFNMEIVHLLINKGCDVNFKNNLNKNILMKALKSQKKDLIQLLFEKGATINNIDYKGRNELLYFIEKIRYIKIEDILSIKQLIMKGINIYHKDNNNLSLMDYLKNKNSDDEENSTLYEIIVDYHNYYKIMIELEELKKINIDLGKELEILNSSLELHPDGNNIKILKNHFYQLSNQK